MHQRVRKAKPITVLFWERSPIVARIIIVIFFPTILLHVFKNLWKSMRIADHIIVKSREMQGA